MGTVTDDVFDLAAPQSKARQIRPWHGARAAAPDPPLCLLGRTLKVRGLIVLVAIGSRAVSWSVLATIKREPAPMEDRGVDAIARAVEAMRGGRIVMRFEREGEQYAVIVQTMDTGRGTPSDIERIFVRGKNDTMIPLSALVKIREVVVPRELNHFAQRRSAAITANLSAGDSVGEALDFMDQTAKNVLKSGYATDLNGINREFRKSSDSLTLVFVLALFFIFLVLAAQFESFIDPFVILFSQIGLITLVGLITTHGILIVAFANQLREQGMRRGPRRKPPHIMAHHRAHRQEH